MVAHTRRKFQAILAHSRPLASVNIVQFVFCVLSTIYLTTGFASYLPDMACDFFGKNIKGILFSYVLAHIWSVSEFFRLHCHFYKRKSTDRMYVLATALLLPPQALRLRNRLIENMVQTQHPLAIALAVGKANESADMAKATLRDIYWPLLPCWLPSLTRMITIEASQLINPIIKKCLEIRAMTDARFSADKLLAQPKVAEKDFGVCAYCPRCGDTFTRMDGSCANGTPLLPLSK
jgi:hypothetical protein